MLFGKKKPDGRTLLVLDIENGSVGGGLVRVAEGHLPKLFGETRLIHKVSPTRDSLSLLHQASDAAQQVVAHLTDVVSRLHNTHNDELRKAGDIQHTAIFLAAPWGVPDLAAGSPSFIEPLTEQVGYILRTAGLSSHTFHTAASAALVGTRTLLPYDDSYLVCMVSGEMSELLLVSDGAVVGYATVPMGRHSVVRTLRAHSGISEHEAHSALRISHDSSAYTEPLESAAAAYAAELAETVSQLMAQGRVERIYTVAHGSAGEWFAKSLAHSAAMNALFPNGGSIRTLRAEHAVPHLSAHAESPDLMIMFQALFVDHHF